MRPGRTLPSIMTTPALVVTGPYSLAEAERYLRETVVPLRLACTTSAGWPLVLSLWYLYRDGSLWCATSPRALILRHIEHDGRCGFEVAPNEPPYRGVRGQARATVLRGGGSALLEELIQRYLGTTASPLARQLLSRAAEEVAIRLTPIRLSSWDYRRRMTSE
ncbi:MAG TPA: hypothetical protein VMI34_21925, partial [Candidatus Bathyarchaeia archaeon]|nr:hypothetical protein [Candidatus Bathyarchaeia archaeon]